MADFTVLKFRYINSDKFISIRSTIFQRFCSNKTPFNASQKQNLDEDVTELGAQVSQKIFYCLTVHGMELQTAVKLALDGHHFGSMGSLSKVIK